MAKKEKGKKKTRPLIYPWDNWLNPDRVRPVKVRKGEGYTSLTHGFISTVRKEASRRGVKVSVTVEEEEGVEVVTIRILRGEKK